MRNILAPLTILLCTATASAQNCITEDFEGVVAGTYSALGATTLNSTTVSGALGGPGLVEPGCSYTTLGNDILWWNAPTFLVSNCISTTFSAQIAIEYDYDIDNMSVELHGFFADTVDATAYDAAGNVLAQQNGIPIVALGSTTVSFSGGNIRKVEFLSALTGGDSAFIGEHTYCASTGPSLTLTGNCPGAVVLDGSGMTPGGAVVILKSLNLGNWIVPGGAPACAGLMLDVVSPAIQLIVAADASGDISIPANVPAAACGVVHVQAVDKVSCGPTNVISL